MRGKKDKKKGKGSVGQNRKATSSYLEKNRHREGVRTLPSGLQVQIREEGNGERPEPDCTVTTDQRTLLIDGTIIQDTYQKGKPESYSLNEAIEGLREGIPLMKCGALYRFVVPPELAWGKRGAGEKIGPHATLIFDIRLRSFEA